MIASSGYCGASVVCCNVDVEIGGVRFVDSVMWDIHQSSLSPLEFSRRTCVELGIGLSFVQPIAQSIGQQLTEYGRKNSMWAVEGTIAPAGENIQTVIIDVRFRSVIFRDRLQWDVNCPYNSPEKFARITVADLNLPQEMEPIIALTIHQQVSRFRMAAPSSTTSNEDAQFKEVEGPCVSSTLNSSSLYEVKAPP
ncbi:unnamed protein product [Ectocarpus sp. 12 AP-2014]